MFFKPGIIMTNNELYRSKPKKNVFYRSYIADAVSAAIFASVIATPLMAATDTDDSEVITVTATKNAESIQDVPLAITALSGEFMDEVHLEDVKDLIAFTPGITGNSPDSFIDAVSIRGIRTQDFGVGGDPSAGFFKNDLYEGRNGSAVSTMFDMDRAEIVRGPQGFLFGRNSISGAVSVHTRKAEIDVQEGFIDLDFAEFNLFKVSGAFNVPVNDNFAMRFAGLYHTEDSFINNSFPDSAADVPGADKKALRWSTTYKKDDLTIYTMAEYEDRDGRGTSYRAVQQGDTWDVWESVFGAVDFPSDPYDVNQDNSEGIQDQAEATNLQLRIEKDVNFADLTISAGYKDHDYYYTEDYEGTPVHVSGYEQDQSGDYSQVEARLNFKTDGPLGWYLGASYYEENIDVTFNVISEEDAMCQYYGYAYYGVNYGCEELYNGYFGYYGSSAFYPSSNGLLEESNTVIGKFTGWAVYVNMDYKVSDTVDIEIGLRTTHDKKTMSNNVPTPESWLGPYWALGFSTDGPITDSKTWDNTSMRFLARWKPQDDMMFYASYTEGYKSGGFGTFNLDRNPAGEGPLGRTGLTQADGFPLNTFDPEIVDSFEVGYKDTWFDHTKVDINAFYYDYKDLQVVTFDDEGGGAAVVKNVGKATGNGVEGTIQSMMSENWNLLFVMSYLSTEATEIQSICQLADENGCEGQSLFWAPTWSGAIVLDGDYPLDNGDSITLSLETYWESNRGRGFENLPETNIEQNITTSMRIGYQPASNWYVEAYIDNVFDERTWAGINNNGGILPAHVWGPSKPRTIGIRMGMTWED